MSSKKQKKISDRLHSAASGGRTYSQNLQSNPQLRGCDEAMAPDSAFMAAPKTCPDGFCSPPCSGISKTNDYRDEFFSACADLTIESVRK
jgi:hypothetical protein